MKKFFVMLALAWGTVGAFAQNEADSVAAVNNAVTLAKEVYPQKEEDGDLYHGLTRKLTFDRMIPPYGLEVTYGKTTHIIFPSSVRYVDPRFSEPHCRQGGRCGKCHSCKGYRKEFP